MSQRPRIVIAQQQRLALNTGLHAAIRMLRSDTAGLTRYLEEQAAENPYLRLIPPQMPALGDWLPRWSGVAGLGGGGPRPEAASAAPSLIAHVMAAIRALELPPEGRRIALALVEALEPSGWLGRSVEGIAQELDLAPDAVRAVLQRLQKLDPPGLFACNLAECLMLQAEDQGVLDPPMQGILAHLDLLAAGETGRLAKLCGCDEDGILRRFRVIRTMNPKPGVAFAGIGPIAAHEPDLTARPIRDGVGATIGWEVALNRSALPSLVVTEGPEADARAPGLRPAAKALCQMLAARNDTLLRVGQAIVARQRAALDSGPGALQPMKMADLAESLGLHVSTISRVVAEASLDSPSGVWWLRRMFSGRFGGAQGRRSAESATAPAQPIGPPIAPPIAAAALRHRLGRIIAEEPPEAPFSDAALALRLTQDTGVVLARRTIAQYRMAENIPPAHRRRIRGVSQTPRPRKSPAP
ncbi:RNA polymerase factor sigma-54 [Tabrizicola sp.]|uniref:RNA polymerase factor sigma-54 n=1 Tax=Tabrizicola sp. TaxID=2005166 RepID=UPI003D2DEFEC